LNPIK